MVYTHIPFLGIPSYPGTKVISPLSPLCQAFPLLAIPRAIRQTDERPFFSKPWGNVWKERPPFLPSSMPLGLVLRSWAGHDLSHCPHPSNSEHTVL